MGCWLATWHHPTQITDDPNPAAPQTRKSWPRNALLAFAGLWTAPTSPMPSAKRNASAYRPAPGEQPRPRGRVPPEYPIWNGALGVWTDAHGKVRPTMSKEQRHDEHRKRRRNASASARDRDAAHGREYVGLHVRTSRRLSSRVATPTRSSTRTSVPIATSGEK